MRASSPVRSRPECRRADVGTKGAATCTTLVTRTLFGAVSAMCALVLGLVAGVTAAGAATSASSLWTRALDAAGTQGSVHYIQVSKAGGQTVTITGDVDRVAGTQKITIRSAKHHGSATVTLVGNTTYVNGDTYGLELTLGMPASLGSQVAGNWISITPSAPDGLYQSTAEELTMSSVISNFAMKGPYTEGQRAHVAGETVIGVKGFMSGTGKKKVPQTFEVRASGRPLPVSSTSTSTGHQATQLDATYSKWGEQVSVRAPTGAIPINQLLQGANPGGGAPGGSTTTTTPQIVTTAARR